MADGRTLKALGIGDVRIELPNGSNKMQALLKDAIHAPDMAFTLISIGCLDRTDCTVTFHKGMCTIKDPYGKMMATIPCSDGLYRLTANELDQQTDYANMASVTMDINAAHRKLGHISHTAVNHAITSGSIAGIKLDTTSKPNFCEACAKSKANHHPFPK